jgi:hypothetical protein
MRLHLGVQAIRQAVANVQVSLGDRINLQLTRFHVGPIMKPRDLRVMTYCRNLCDHQTALDRIRPQMAQPIRSLARPTRPRATFVILTLQADSDMRLMIGLQTLRFEVKKVVSSLDAGINCRVTYYNAGPRMKPKDVPIFTFCRNPCYYQAFPLDKTVPRRNPLRYCRAYRNPC